MLNEGHVTMLWQNLFRGQAITAETLKKASQLLEELRPESPLRFRLETELAEIRVMQQPDGAASAKSSSGKAAMKKSGPKIAGPKKPRVKRPKAAVIGEPPAGATD
jgi:hypothetical protein